jgi:hypothetical protein
MPEQVAAEFSYSFRERIGDSVRIDVSDDGIRYRSTKAGTVDTPWRQIRRIGLISPLSGVHVCVLETTAGQKLLLANRSVASPGEIREQNGPFVDFVWKLHARAAEHPSIHFRSGHAGWFLFAVLSLGLLAALILALIGVTIWALLRDRLRQTLPIWVSGSLVFIVPKLLHWARHNRVRDYDPRAIPDELLPARGGR